MKNIIICDAGKPDEATVLCRKYNLGIEIQSFFPPDSLDDQELLSRTAAIIDDINFRSIHGAFIDLCPGSEDREIRKITKRRYEQSLAIAEKLNASHIVFHHGYVPHASWPALWLEYWHVFWKEFFNDNNPGIRIYIENHVDTDPDLISDSISSINRDDFKINLDIGHANFSSKIPIVKWIEKLNAKIGYVHLHDNHGMDDEHLGLGKGNIPVLDVCNALEEYSPDSIWAIESVNEGRQQSLDWLGENGFL